MVYQLMHLGANLPILPAFPRSARWPWPDSQTRMLTDIAPGFEIYGYEGERLRGVVPTLLGLGSFEGSPSLYSERARRSDWDAPFTSPFQGL